MRLEKALRKELNIKSIPKTMALQGYGYQEFITRQTPTNITAQRLGSLIGTLDVLGTTDIHNGNLILDSEQAWLIDGEAILHRFCNQRIRKNSKTPLLGDSILSMGVINPPFRKALFGSSFSLLKHGLTLLTEGTGNSLPTNHTNTCNFAELNKHELLVIEYYCKELNNPVGAGGIERKDFKIFDGLKRRVVMRNTSIYGDLLRQVERQKNMPQVERTLDTLWKVFHDNLGNKELVDLAQAEMIEITRGHIPIFYTRIGGSKIDAGNNIRLPARTHQKILKNSIHRQAIRTSAQEQIFQQALFKSALQLVRKPCLDKAVAHPEQLRNASQVLHNHLTETRIAWKDDSFWLSLHIPENTEQPSYVARNGFYGGNGGIQVALELLGEKQLQEKPIQTTNQNKHRKKINLSAGIGLAELTSDLLVWGCSGRQERKYFDHDIRAAIKSIEKQLESTISEEKLVPNKVTIEYDIISGLAGFIGGLQSCKVCLHSKDIDLINSIQKLAAYVLINTQLPEGSWLSTNQILNNLTGWSHGSAGIAAALAVVRKDADQQLATAIDKAINAAIQHELNHLTPDGDWIDKRTKRIDPSKDDGIGQSWCHGAPGSLLAAVVLHRYKVPFTPEIQKWTELAIDSTRRAKPWSDSLCCGKAGITLIEEIAATEFERPNLQKKAQERRVLLQKKSFTQGFNLGPYFPLTYNAPGLFDGIAGIALSLRFRGSDSKIQTLLSFGML